MKFFMVLLPASLAATSLAILDEPEGEIHSETQPADASAQVTPSSHPKKDHVSNEASLGALHLQRRAGFQKECCQKSTHPKRTISKMLSSNYSSATASEGKLAKLAHKIGKNLDKALKGIINYLKNLIPSANDVMRP
uniref:Glycosylation-dependent cell adhesion molecule 1 n=1 Tax=Homo sapiens TaxID=9606 RepID=A0A6F8V636_HUMAN|nr:glycosylation-dependent cell adhesion molecule 1 [Homo sapiens]BCB25114.1 glycosylation-dependent cell adhesion molecule 1 [Homo sapiens]